MSEVKHNYPTFFWGGGADLGRFVQSSCGSSADCASLLCAGFCLCPGSPALCLASLCFLGFRPGSIFASAADLVVPLLIKFLFQYLPVPHMQTWLISQCLLVNISPGSCYCSCVYHKVTLLLNGQGLLKVAAIEYTLISRISIPHAAQGADLPDIHGCSRSFGFLSCWGGGLPHSGVLGWQEGGEGPISKQRAFSSGRCAQLCPFPSALRLLCRKRTGKKVENIVLKGPINYTLSCRSPDVWLSCSRPGGFGLEGSLL